MTVVKADDVIVKPVPAAEAPEKRLSNPSQVIGKALAVKMEKEQVFTKACFATEGSGLRLASVLKEGKRAVSVSLADYSALAGLLYPGSFVDVLVSVKVPVPQGQGRTKVVSTTILTGIQVLAVGDHTVFTEGTSKAKSDDLRRRRRLIVTLLVDPEQAQKLQLADETGSISLSLRNPTDTEPIIIGMTGLADLPNSPQLAALMAPKPLPQPAATTQASPTTPVAEKPKEQRETDVIRGSTLHIEKFPVQEKYIREQSPEGHQELWGDRETPQGHHYCLEKQA